jgi:hypothetical protein
MNCGAAAKPVDNGVDGSAKLFAIQCPAGRGETSLDFGKSDCVRINRDAESKKAYESNQRSKSLKQESFS